MFLPLFILFSLCVGGLASASSYREALAEGDSFVTKGKAFYSHALVSYSTAIQLDSNDSRALLRRADVYKLRKDYRESLQDLGLVLRMEPKNRSALASKALLLIYVLDVRGAAAAFETLSSMQQETGYSEKAKTSELNAEKLKEFAALIDQFELNPHENPQLCVQVFTALLEMARDSLQLQLRRIVCAIHAKEHSYVMNELRQVAIKSPSNVDVLLLQARELRALGAEDEATKHLRRCLTLDPENKPCQTLNKDIKLTKRKRELFETFYEKQQWTKLVNHVDAWLVDSEKNKNNLFYESPALEELKKKQCIAFLNLKKVTKGLASCASALEAIGSDSPASAEIHLLNAELHALNEDLDTANAELEEARQKGGSEFQQRISEVAQKLEKLKHQLARKNYYRILGVPRTATKKKIRKAFRELALQFHPDKVSVESEKERERLAAKYRDINEAKEVLLDEDKRRRYDDGEEIFGHSTQQQQQQQQQDPFAQFNGGNFRFHF